MPVLSFKPEFREKILNGTKYQTIRKLRKNPIVEGDLLYMYINQRSRNNEFLGRAQCIICGPVIIPRTGGIIMAGDRDMDEFARADGFDSIDCLLGWFQATHGFPFEGQYIRWFTLHK